MTVSSNLFAMEAVTACASGLIVSESTVQYLPDLLDADPTWLLLLNNSDVDLVKLICRFLLLANRSYTVLTAVDCPQTPKRRVFTAD